MNETKIDYLPLGQVRPSATNPRKHFDPAYIAELTDSIRIRGIKQPLSVRPDWCMGKTDEEIAKVNGNAPAPEFFEIVAGECRYRGATAVPLASVPVIVRFLSDKETLEDQLIENLQRKDLTAIEEALGYQRLIDEMGHTVESIHERTGKAKRTIYGALKLLRAPKFFLKAIEEKVVGKRLGELVGRIPTAAERVAAAEDILKPRLTVIKAAPLTYSEASDMIQEWFMRSLSGAPFPQSDATLVPIKNDEATGERVAGGACDDCPLKTGNNPDLFGDLKRTDVCTNPKCFNAKCDAQFARLQAEAAKEGKKILTADEAAEIFEADGRIRFDSNYASLAQQPDAAEVRDDVRKRPSWKALLEPLSSKPQVAVVRDPKGRIVELVDRKLAIEAVNLAAKQKGEKSIFDKTSNKAGSTSASSNSATTAAIGASSDAEKKKREEAKVVFQVTLASFSALIAAIDAAGPVKGFWDELIRASVTHAGHDGCWLICKVHGLDPKAKNKTNDMEGVQGAALEYGLTLPDEKLKLGNLVELLLSQRVKFSNAYSDGLRAVESFQAFAKLYKVDLAAVEKKVRAEAKEGKAALKKKKTAQRGKKIEPIKNPTNDQLEHCCEPSVGTAADRGFSRSVIIKGKHYVVTAICYPGSGPTEYGLQELLPADNAANGATIVPRSGTEETYVLGEKQWLVKGKLHDESPALSALETKPAKHKWEKISDNKYRCRGCGGAAVKHEGKMLEEKAIRGKACSQSEVKAKTNPPSRKATAQRAKRSKSAGKKSTRKATAKKGGAKK